MSTVRLPRSRAMRSTYPLSRNAVSGLAGRPRISRQAATMGRTSRQNVPRNASSAWTRSQARELLAIHQRGLHPDLLRSDDGLHRRFHFALQVVALVDHEGDVEALAFTLGGMNLMEDAEYLVRINGAKRQVVVGIASVVEMKSTQHPG